MARKATAGHGQAVVQRMTGGAAGGIEAEDRAAAQAWVDEQCADLMR